MATGGKARAVGVLVALLAALVAFHETIERMALEPLAWLSVTVAALSYWIVLKRAPSGGWSVGSLFLLLLALFHFGDMLMIAWHIPFSPAERQYVALWLYGPMVPIAVYLSMLATVSYALAYVAASSGPRPPADQGLAPDPRGKAFAALGATMVVLGVVAYLGYAVTHAPQVLFGGNYETYNIALGGNRVIGLAGLVTTMGLILVAAAPACTSRRLALLVFGLYSVILLYLGVRTAILFPTVAAAVAAARTHKMPRGRNLLIVVLLMLALTGLVKQTRDSHGSGLSVAALNPLSSVAELGGTLRPVAEVVGWHELAHERRDHGVSYALPFERLGTRALGLPEPPLDDRMMRRTAPFQIGYSPVAEAYQNFGPLGVAVVFVLFGLALAAVDRRPSRSIVGACAAGVAMAAVGITVRNSFISLPSNVIAGTLVIVLANQIALLALRSRSHVAFTSGVRRMPATPASVARGRSTT